MTIPLVDKVVETRIGMIRNELSEFFPEASIEATTDKDGRAVIRMTQERWVIGMEFVETDSSWNDPKRFRDYYIALVNKCRLGVIVPKDNAMSARLKLLEFNQRWLFYYQVFSYDDDGNLRKIGRPHDDGTKQGPVTTLPGYL